MFNDEWLEMSTDELARLLTAKQITAKYAVLQGERLDAIYELADLKALVECLLERLKTL